MKNVSILFCATLLMLFSCKTNTPTTVSYEVIKTKILNDSTFASLPEEEKLTLSDSLVHKLKNDTDFNTYARNMETLYLSRLDSTRQQSSEDKKSLIMAITGMGTKFPELRKLPKETQKEIMEEAGDTLSRDIKNQLKNELSQNVVAEKP